MPGHSEVTATRKLQRDLQKTLLQAADVQLIEVVSLVDSMPDRGDADALLAPLRWRLQSLRPRRPLSLKRLMFLPADPIIMPARLWHRGMPAIPRTALACIGAQVLAGLGATAATLDAEIQGAMVDDHAAVHKIGSRLWPMAADILAQGGPPPDWSDNSGLTALDHAALAQPLSIVLRQAAAIESMVHPRMTIEAASVGAIRTCVSLAIATIPPHASAFGVQGIAMLLAILIARLPGSEQIVTAASDLALSLCSPLPRLAADLAIDFALDSLEGSLAAETTLCHAAHDLGRLARLLDTIEQPGPASRPTRKARAAQLRCDVDRACRSRFEHDAEQHLLANAPQLGLGASDADVISLEATALDLRRFEFAARAFGSGPHYDRMLRETANRLAETAPRDANPIDVARLVEILQGPEAALAWLQTPPASPSPASA